MFGLSYVLLHKRHSSSKIDEIIDFSVFLREEPGRTVMHASHVGEASMSQESINQDCPLSCGMAWHGPLSFRKDAAG